MAPARILWLKRAVLGACLMPLAALAMEALRRGLGANPIAAIEHSTGRWALVLLLVTLSVTPLRRITGLYWLLRFRRMLGLYAFAYACLHVLSYVVLDQFFDWTAIFRDIARLRFMTAGFVSFVLLIPLALTATNGMMRRLGAKRWQQLHRLVYVIAIGSVLHYIWLVKLDTTEPDIYATILALLLGFRVFEALGRRVRRAVADRTPPLPADGTE
ncbi:MAG: protein-methionine-sulfoxide reductase heme-binding subunit MsrQ [Acidiferrobacterales bacterium]